MSRLREGSLGLMNPDAMSAAESMVTWNVLFKLAWAERGPWQLAQSSANTCWNCAKEEKRGLVPSSLQPETMTITGIRRAAHIARMDSPRLLSMTLRVCQHRANRASENGTGACW